MIICQSILFKTEEYNRIKNIIKIFKLKHMNYFTQQDKMAVNKGIILWKVVFSTIYMKNSRLSYRYR